MDERSKFFIEEIKQKDVTSKILKKINMVSNWTLTYFSFYDHFLCFTCLVKRLKIYLTTGGIEKYMSIIKKKKKSFIKQ